jgi:hypothetical protein
MWLQHDRIPFNFGRVVLEYLDKDYEGRWIGRGGPVAWPTHSFDLNPLHLLLCGSLKLRAYHSDKLEEQGIS